MTSLVKKIDEATAKNSGCKMASFVIFCTDDKDAMEKKLKEMATKNKLDKTVLAIDNPAGPKGYDINKDASVTVLLYSGRKVKANFAFEKGKLSASDVEKILKELPAITESEPKKK